MHQQEAPFTCLTCFVLDHHFFKTLKILFAKIPFSENCHQITYFLWSPEENEYAGIKYPINLQHLPKNFYWWRYWFKESRNSLESNFFAILKCPCLSYISPDFFFFKINTLQIFKNSGRQAWLAFWSIYKAVSNLLP